METIFNRKAYAEMLDWKNHLADKYALLVEGARRVGKTFLLRRFAEQEYDSYIYIDFSHLTKDVKAAKRAFTEAADIADLIMQLELIFAVKLIPGRSCL
ncbi:MAG: AAA family ATPase, partial [Victivallales bacterium]|nr:AAA family ATPase [Victivallales bacterium]